MLTSSSFTQIGENIFGENMILALPQITNMSTVLLRRSSMQRHSSVQEVDANLHVHFLLQLHNLTGRSMMKVTVGIINNELQPLSTVPRRVSSLRLLAASLLMFTLLTPPPRSN